MTPRTLRGFEATREAIAQCMAEDDSVYVMGLGASDVTGTYGTTAGLATEFGDDRVFDMPTSENAMTGVAIGSAISGMRPIMAHQRIDFATLAMEQIVNQAAKWRYMFGEEARVPLVIRMVIGRGWGQGPQHSQSLQSWFAHVPGLKVVMPATPKDAKGLLISSIEDDDPVVFIEHRWIYTISGHVPERMYRVPIGKAQVLREGRDVTIVALSYMTFEALRAAEMLSAEGVRAGVVDVRTLRPLDTHTIVQAVRSTGRLIVADTSWKLGGFAGEIVATVAEEAHDCLVAAPRRITLPDSPSPTSPALSSDYYPRAVDIARNALEMLDRSTDGLESMYRSEVPLDVPDMSFTGPF